ncbi:integral membrane 2A [Pelobates cultripes]|uniref:Integral membrane protein 2 n=1 Tax=Pelobates cultripes TaxID=61616 RepID=A0AAD1SY95_PELCU|nr:integral membrane 2A [Pelobates cultripes]
MVKIAFSSPFAAKQPSKDAEALVLDKDPEVAAHGTENSTGRCLLTLLGLAFILAGLIVGGACIYKYFMPRHKFEGKMAYMDHGEEPYYLPVSEEADIREDDNVAFISVPVPSFEEGDSAAIVHDFDRLLTAYLDLELQKCYVIDLNTSVVLPPRNLMDLFMKLASGAYLPQTYLVREELVVTERIDDVADLGIFIYQHCIGKETYRLQRRDQIIGLQKRSAENCASFKHFENTFVVETRICK